MALILPLTSNWVPVFSEFLWLFPLRKTDWKKLSIGWGERSEEGECWKGRWHVVQLRRKDLPINYFNRRLLSSFLNNHLGCNLSWAKLLPTWPNSVCEDWQSSWMGESGMEMNFHNSSVARGARTLPVVGAKAIVQVDSGNSTRDDIRCVE